MKKSLSNSRFGFEGSNSRFGFMSPDSQFALVKDVDPPTHPQMVKSKSPNSRFTLEDGEKFVESKSPNSRFTLEDGEKFVESKSLAHPVKGKLSTHLKIPHDIVGDIAILKFPFDMKVGEKKKLGLKFLKEHKNIVTVLEKSGRFKGRLRKLETKFIAGVKKKETIHKESGCRFFLNVDETYFSPRLSNERRLVAEKVKKGDKVLVLFAGVAPFSIVIAKLGKPEKVVSVEINKKASKFAEKNVRLNMVRGVVDVVQGDVKKVKLKEKFDFIVMPRPNLKDTFLEVALRFAKKGTRFYYHGFGTREGVLEEVRGAVGGKVGKLKIRKAGDIGAGRWRWVVSFVVK